MVWYKFWMSVTFKRYRIVDTKQSGSHGCFPTVFCLMKTPGCAGEFIRQKRCAAENFL